ncbi:hypothetical protein ALC62_09689 [Cyphomyrmex costatus]|uniref:Uncharacterized protein n=1 Tax=Cyphomyrmex costatus TaxID=456900 RepID=A0A151IFA7_9HYME|nr:hypothetical protein ALC62_09689 [Cyphomyrmex costatus]
MTYSASRDFRLTNQGLLKDHSYVLVVPDRPVTPPQIRQRRIDSAGLRATVRRERGLEHEDVLLPAGWLQFRAVVDIVEQHVLRPSDLAGGLRGVPKPSWLIRIVLQDDGPALRTSHATLHKTSIIKTCTWGGRWEGNVAPSLLHLGHLRRTRSRLSTCESIHRELSFGSSILSKRSNKKLQH